MIVAAPPAIVVQAHRQPHVLRLDVRVDVDPGRRCVVYSFAGTSEPDLGEDGSDSCGSPARARLVVRLFTHGRTVVRRAIVRLHSERGRVTLRLPVKGVARWSVTVISPFGRNGTARG